MDLSVQIEKIGLTWPRWKCLVAEIERLGFAGLYLCDHLAVPWPEDVVTIDAWTALGYLADHSTRLRFGPLVSPLSFRDPVILARQAMDLDNLSSGRFVLGVGAGWIDREHQMFGWNLGDVKTRMDRLAEGLEVITRLCCSDEPVSFEGRFYTLREAKLLPHTQRPNGPDIMVGSNQGRKRSVALAARYGTIWNVGGKPVERLAEISRLLDASLAAHGRPATAVRRTMMANVTPWRTEPSWSGAPASFGPTSIPTVCFRGNSPTSVVR